VPTYCSPAHRQAAYRERVADSREPDQPHLSLRLQIEMLRAALEDVSRAKSWSEARRLLAEWLETDRRSIK